MDKVEYLKETVLSVVNKSKNPLLIRDLPNVVNKFYDENKHLPDDQFILKASEQFGSLINTLTAKRQINKLDTIEFISSVFFILTLLAIVVSLFKACGTIG